MKQSQSQNNIKPQKQQSQQPASTIPIQAAFKLFCMNNEKAQDKTHKLPQTQMHQPAIAHYSHTQSVGNIHTLHNNASVESLTKQNHIQQHPTLTKQITVDNFYQMPQANIETHNSQQMNPMLSPSSSQQQFLRCFSQERLPYQIQTPSQFNQFNFQNQNRPPLSPSQAQITNAPYDIGFMKQSNPMFNTFQFSENGQEITKKIQTNNNGNEQNVYLNLLLVDAFKQIYRQLDPNKKGYIKLKDLSDAVKPIDGEQRRNALIKFFVSFVKQTNKYYISKVSFLTNCVNAYLHKKYDLHLFVGDIESKINNLQQKEKAQKQQSLKLLQSVNEGSLKHSSQNLFNNIALPIFELNEIPPTGLSEQQQKQIMQNLPQGTQKSLEDDINLLYYKYFSGQVSKSNQLSKQNELYIQHLLAQSQAYQQSKRTASSNKENVSSSQQQITMSNSSSNLQRKASPKQIVKNLQQQSRNEKLKLTKQSNNLSVNSNFTISAKQLKTNKMGPNQTVNKSLKQSGLNSTNEIIMNHSTFDSNRNRMNNKK